MSTTATGASVSFADGADNGYSVCYEDAEEEATGGEGLDRLTPLLRTSSRMDHSFRLLTTKIHSLELLNPAPDSVKRRSTLCSSTFNLIATIVGGGVLSMPLAFAKSGILLGTILMILGGIITDLSLYLLVSCARKTGATTYGAVARHAFGPGLEFATSLIMVIFLLLLLVAFMVLVRGIWSPMVKELVVWSMAMYEQADASSSPSEVTVDEDIDTPAGPMTAGVDSVDNLVLLGIVLSALPAFLKEELYALRHCCYLSFFSISLLCIAMGYRAIERNYQEPNLYSQEVLYFTSSLPDALFAYPIIALAFTSTFNVIEVHCALSNPTRPRIQSVIHAAVFWSFVLMLLFSLAGYLFAYEATDGNIVLNFDPSDPIILVGRIGCGICTLLAMPMALLPLRDAIQALPIQYEVWMDTRGLDMDYTKLGGPGGTTEDILKALTQAKLKADLQQQQQRLSNGGMEQSPTRAGKDTASNQEVRGQGEETFALLSQNANKRSLSYASTTSDATNNTQSTTSTWATKMASFRAAALSFGTDLRNNINEEQWIHCGLTAIILISTYLGAVLAPGVAIVWQIMGSNLAFIIQYILPAACYLKLRQGKRPTIYTHSAWALLVLSIVGATACTIQTIWRIFFFKG